MNCPKCKTENPPDSHVCGFCHEVLIHTLKIGGGVIKIYGNAFPQSPPNLLSRPSSPPRPSLEEEERPSRAKVVFLALLGVAFIGAGAAYYYLFSPTAPLQLNGVQLEQPTVLKQPLVYLIGTRSFSQSWAERNGQMDTPLPDAKLQETGRVSVEAASQSGTNEALQVRAHEWIKFETDTQQAVPATHSSLTPARVTLDPQRALLERQSRDLLRVGRAINLIFPRFPKGTQRPGNTWTETVRWADVLGQWKILWVADLKWTFVKYESRYNLPCARLTCQANLTPRLLQVPEWAKKLTGQPTFKGQASGEALYDAKNKSLLSNALGYSGNLSIPINNLESIPWEQRVGNPLTAEPGSIIVQFDNKVDVRNIDTRNP